MQEEALIARTLADATAKNSQHNEELLLKLSDARVEAAKCAYAAELERARAGEAAAKAKAEVIVQMANDNADRVVRARTL